MRAFPALAILAVPTLLAGQAPPASAPARPTVDFSGLVFGNFQYRTDSAARFATGGKPMSKFDVGRAYLTFRMPAGDRANVRVTTDIFQQTGGAAAYYGGWVVRLKYAILQYDFANNIGGTPGFNATARVGMLHTVTVDHIENFWPRWLDQTSEERFGFFSSADLGVASLVTLPNQRGEVYATFTNGSGYAAPETDRFKDLALRVSLTPFSHDSGLIRTFTISPWYYKGWNASQFVTGGGAQVGPVSDGLQKDRRGIFAGLRDRKLTLGAEFSQRVEGLESGANTVASPRVVRTRTSNLTSAFGVIRPTELFGGSKSSRFSLVGRFDQFKLDRDLAPEQHFALLGAAWNLTAKTSVALDYQALTWSSNPTGVPTRTLFMHWSASF